MGVRGVTDLMVAPGLVNLDFADIRTVMAEMGKAMMGTGESDGENRAIRAAEAAISNPLLEDTSMAGARGLLINITGGDDMTLFEVDQAANRIREEVAEDANIIFGSAIDESLTGRIRVSVVATGIDTPLPLHAERPRMQDAAPAPNGLGHTSPHPLAQHTPSYGASHGPLGFGSRAGARKGVAATGPIGAPVLTPQMNHPGGHPMGAQGGAMNLQTGSQGGPHTAQQPGSQLGSQPGSHPLGQSAPGSQDWTQHQSPSAAPATGHASAYNSARPGAEAGARIAAEAEHAPVQAPPANAVPHQLPGGQRAASPRAGLFSEPPRNQPEPAPVPNRSLFGIVTGALRRAGGPQPGAAGMSQEPRRAEPQLHESVVESSASVRPAGNEETGLDIPAFLRRQS
jgi:cell division protein FtsZ